MTIVAISEVIGTITIAILSLVSFVGLTMTGFHKF